MAIVTFPADIPIVSQDLPRLVYPGQTVIEHPFASTAFGPSVISRGIALWETSIEFLIATPAHARSLNIFVARLAGPECFTFIPVNLPLDRTSTGTGMLVSDAGTNEVTAPNRRHLHVSPPSDFEMRAGKMFSLRSGILYVLDTVVDFTDATETVAVLEVLPNIAPKATDIGERIRFDTPVMSARLVDIPQPLNVTKVLHSTISLRFRFSVA